MVEHGQTVQLSPGGNMFKQIQIDVFAVTFGWLRLLSAITIWSCHAWVAPTFRWLHGSASSSGLCSLPTDKVASSKFRVHNLKTRYFELLARHSRPFVQLRPGASRIERIPRIWQQGIKQSMGQGETPNPELLPARSAPAKAGQTPNFKGCTLPKEPQPR